MALDVARCLALLGMVATHVLADRDPAGELLFGQSIAGGRASALFAVLAGVTIALGTGRREPVRGRERAARSAGLSVRALLVAAIGLGLGEVESGLAVILTYYGVLFLLGLPFLGLRSRGLFTLAAVWVLVMPIVSHLVRPELPARGYANPTFGQLVDEPGRLLSELLLTGYYPVLPWLAYLFVGLAVGRLDLSRRRVQAVLAGVGVALAVGSTYLSRALTGLDRVREALLSRPPAPDADAAELLDRIRVGMYGTTPTGGAGEWLLVVAPHSATPFDLVQTIGSSLLVIGVALLVLGAVEAVDPRGRVGLAVLFGAGTMTLSLYSLHVLMRTRQVWPAESPDTFRLHVLVLLGIGAAYVALGQRGPAERLVGAVSSSVTRLVRGRRTSPSRQDPPSDPGPPSGPTSVATGPLDLGTGVHHHRDTSGGDSGEGVRVDDPEL